MHLSQLLVVWSWMCSLHFLSLYFALGTMTSIIIVQIKPTGCKRYAQEAGGWCVYQLWDGPPEEMGREPEDNRAGPPGESKASLRQKFLLWEAVFWLRGRGDFVTMARKPEMKGLSPSGALLVLGLILASVSSVH